MGKQSARKRHIRALRANSAQPSPTGRDFDSEPEATKTTLVKILSIFVFLGFIGSICVEAYSYHIGKSAEHPLEQTPFFMQPESRNAFPDGDITPYVIILGKAKGSGRLYGLAAVSVLTPNEPNQDRDQVAITFPPEVTNVAALTQEQATAMVSVYNGKQVESIPPPMTGWATVSSPSPWTRTLTQYSARTNPQRNGRREYLVTMGINFIVEPTIVKRGSIGSNTYRLGWDPHTIAGQDPQHFTSSASDPHTVTVTLCEDCGSTIEPFVDDATRVSRPSDGKTRIKFDSRGTHFFEIRLRVEPWRTVLLAAHFILAVVMAALIINWLDRRVTWKIWSRQPSAPSQAPS